MNDSPELSETEKTVLGLFAQHFQRLEEFCSICGFRYGLHRPVPDLGRCPTEAETYFTSNTRAAALTEEGE